MKRSLIPILCGIFMLCSCRSGIKVVSYNVGTFTKSGEDCTQMIAGMLSEKNVDFVGLCELDSCTIRTGGRDQLAELASKMKGSYQAVFAPSLDFQGGKYGIGMLVKANHPVLSTEVIKLEKGDGAEQRVLCIAQTPEVIFAVTHLDHKGLQARMQQCEQITEVLSAKSRQSGKDVILCGDFNSAPESAEMQYMREHWIQSSPSQNTFPSDSARVCIDYVFILKEGSLSCRDSYVVESTKTFDAARASDHLAVFAELR